jgi:4-amino-4-deoxy-L-arabinose transferase-like glycosyltransferase
MSVSHPPSEESPELDKESAPAPSSVSLAVLSEHLDERGQLEVWHREANFFVLAPRARLPLAQIGENGHHRENGRNGEVRGVAIASSETLPGVLVGPLTPLQRARFALLNLRANLLAVPGYLQRVHPALFSALAWCIAVVGQLVKKKNKEEALSTGALLQTGIKTAGTVLTHIHVPMWLEITVMLLGLLITLLSHAINLFNFPRYESDEGVYTMYAWAMTYGRISPYAYGYGHPPFAWMQIAAWSKLIGGFSVFGNAINTSRVLVLLLVVGSAWLIYRIARHLGISLYAALLAVVVFALSPLSITFQRAVLLDNFAVFWYLLSLYLLLVSKSRLFYMMAGGACFGLALLSKEVLLIFLPAMIYVAWLYTARFQRTFLIIAFTYSIVAVGSTFVLMAALKGELFPYGWHLPGDNHPHLSLIDTYIVQVKRGENDGSLSESWNSWMQADPLLILLGIVTPAFNLIFGLWNRKHLFLALFALIFWGLLVRGGVIFAFYIIPLIPLIALNTAIMLDTIVRWPARLLRFEAAGGLLIIIVLLALIPYNIQRSLAPYNVYAHKPSQVQTQTLAWIRAHVPRRAVVIVNSNLFTDLHEPESAGVGEGGVYPYAHVYWFAALDPEIHDTLLKNNWDRIDYVIVDPEMAKNIQTYGGAMDLIKTAQDHSVLRAEFKGDNNEFMRIYQVIHINSSPDI